MGMKIVLDSGVEILQSDSGHLKFAKDADEAKFFNLQIEGVKKEILEVKYPENTFLRYFPISKIGSKGDDAVSYLMYDKVGNAEIVANDAEDIPTVDIYGQKRIVDVFPVALAYKYTEDDLWKAASSGLKLPTLRAKACRDGIERKLEQIGWVGDDKWGVKGIVNHPNIVFSTVPAGGGGATDWLTKTPLEDLYDLNQIYGGMVSLVENAYTPNAMFMPIEVLEHLRSTPLDSANGSNVSILEFFLRNHRSFKTIVGTNRLLNVPDQPATGTTNSAIFCCLDAECVTIEIPIRFHQSRTEMRGFTFKVACKAKTAGVISPQPLTIHNVQNVLD